MDKTKIFFIFLIAIMTISCTTQTSNQNYFDDYTLCINYLQQNNIQGDCIYVDERIATCSHTLEGKYIYDTMPYTDEIDQYKWNCFYQTNGPLKPEEETI